MATDRRQLAKQHRRELRQNQTDAERLFWAGLRNRRLNGHKFRRQHSIGPFIVNFVCLDAKTVVELDGGYHDHVVQRDIERQRLVERQGFLVLRYTNDDVFQDVEGVLMGIANEVTKRAPHPGPLPRGERGQHDGAEPDDARGPHRPTS